MNTRTWVALMLPLLVLGSVGAISSPVVDGKISIDRAYSGVNQKGEIIRNKFVFRVNNPTTDIAYRFHIIPSEQYFTEKQIIFPTDSPEKSAAWMPVFNAEKNWRTVDWLQIDSINRDFDLFPGETKQVIGYINTQGESVEGTFFGSINVDSTRIREFCPIHLKMSMKYVEVKSLYGEKKVWKCGVDGHEMSSSDLNIEFSLKPLVASYIAPYTTVDYKPIETHLPNEPIREVLEKPKNPPTLKLISLALVVIVGSIIVVKRRKNEKSDNPSNDSTDD